jgi:membrane-associated phospholipid phosphatase
MSGCTRQRRSSCTEEKVANDIAAMPSLHAAYPMLLLLFFWARARPWMRALLVGYVLAMAFSLVYLGEHFVIDELAGWCAAAAVYFGGSRLLDWRQRRRQQQQGQWQCRQPPPHGGLAQPRLGRPATRTGLAVTDA